MKQRTLSLEQNLLWSSAGSLFYFASQWLITILVTRLSGYKDAGNLSLAMSISNLFYCIASYGIRNFQVSDVNNKYDSVTYIESRYLTALASIFLCLIFTFISRYNKETIVVIFLYMLFRVLESIVDVYHGVDQRFSRMDIIGVSFFLRGLASLFIFVVLFVAYKNLAIGIIGIVFGTMSIIVFYDIPYARLIDASIRERSIYKVRIGKIIPLLKECLPLVFYLLLSTGIISLPRFILEKMTDNVILGIYSSIATPVVLIQVAATYIFTPFIVLFAKAFAERDRFKFFQLFFKCVGYISVMSSVVLVVAFLFGDQLLAMIFGSSILEYSYLLVPLIFCAIAIAFVWFLSALLIVTRSLNALILSCGISLVVCIILSVVFIKLYDMQGVNYAILISLTLQIAFLLIAGKRRLDTVTKENFNLI